MPEKAKTAKRVFSILKSTYTPSELDFVRWSNPLELLVATVLSAQCTDVAVNRVTEKLFKKYRHARDYAKARIDELERETHSLGFFRRKSKYLKDIGTILVKEYDGKVPQSLESLLSLPGVAHKTAYLVMSKGFGKHFGVAVDTHVKRVAPRLGLTDKTSADAISKDLSAMFDPKEYLDINEYLIVHGRKICKPKPLCRKCPLNMICPSAVYLSKERVFVYRRRTETQSAYRRNHPLREAPHTLRLSSLPLPEAPGLRPGHAKLPCSRSSPLRHPPLRYG